VNRPNARYKLVDGYLVRIRRKPRRLRGARKFLDSQGYDYKGNKKKNEINAPHTTCFKVTGSQKGMSPKSGER
jgi:hypothetical protein